VQRNIEHLVEAVLERGGQRLTAAEHPAQPGAARRRRVLQKDAQHGRHEVHGRHTLAHDQVGQVAAVAVSPWPGQHHGGAEQQRPEEFPHGHVEAERRLVEHPVVRAEAVLVLHPHDPVHDRRVADHHTLRPTGGAGCVDHVGQVIRTSRGDTTLTGDARWTRLLLLTDEDERRLRNQPACVGLVADDCIGVGIGHHEREPLGRVVRVEGQVGRTDPEDGVDGHDELHRPIQVDADQAPGLHAGPSQNSRPCVDLSSELAIGQGPAVADEGGCVWGSPHLFVEQVHERLTGPVEHQHPSRP
jgi:hypothetical protein